MPEQNLGMEVMMKKSKTCPQFSKQAYASAALLLLSLGFYAFFAAFDGAVICVDSPSYIQMNISREPLYSLFLAGLRALFAGVGGDAYLTAAAWIQSILAAFAAWSLTRFLWKECRLPSVVAAALLCMPFAVSLLCRFAAKRGSMYSNSILTEGLAIPLYLLFFRYILEYFFHRTRKSLLLSCLITFLMISARKQMLIALAMLMVCLIAAAVIPGYGEEEKRAPSALGKRLGRGILQAGVCAALILASVSLFDLGYNYALRGNAVTHSSDGRFITTMAFYTAEREDASYIEDEEIRELFLEIYDACDAQGYLKHSAGEGWLDRVTHFGDYYDCIQIDTMWPMVNDYVRARYGDGEVELSENADRVMGVINASVLPHNLGSLMGSFLDNFLSGLITTVAQRKVILIWYSAFVYLLYAALLLWHFKRARHSRITATASLTLVSILCNVGLVSLVIFCQTRYTIYNMALFYISLILLIYSFAARQNLLPKALRWAKLDEADQDV